MLKEANPDVVDVFTPPETHVGLTLEALEAVTHVYLEKPFAPSFDDARKILDKAKNQEKIMCRTSNPVWRNV